MCEKEFDKEHENKRKKFDSVLHEIEESGLMHVLLYYKFEEIEDQEFHELKTKALSAMLEFGKYIGYINKNNDIDSYYSWDDLLEINKSYIEKYHPELDNYLHVNKCRIDLDKFFEPILGEKSKEKNDEKENDEKASTES